MESNDRPRLHAITAAWLKAETSCEEEVELRRLLSAGKVQRHRHNDAAARTRTAFAMFGREASRSMESIRVLSETGRSLELCENALQYIISDDQLQNR